MPRKPRLRLPNGQFIKGVSGNPGGRPASQRELIERCRRKGTAMLEVLIRLAEDPLVDAPVQMRCAQVVLEMGFGKPVPMNQMTDGDDDADLGASLDHLSDELLEQLAVGAIAASATRDRRALPAAPPEADPAAAPEAGAEEPS